MAASPASRVEFGRLDRMPEWIKKYLMNVGAGYGLRVGQLGLNPLAIPVLLTALGDTSYGWLVFLSTAVGYFSLLNFGVADAMSKFVAEFHASKDWQALRELISTVFGLFLFMAALAAVGCWAATWFTWGI
jgi:O-antigen/teichoic acid export membrane protein